MSKIPKRIPSMIGGVGRCEICTTKLTLYPRDYLDCPHCHKTVCRQCWGESWVQKAFTAENCSHLLESDGLTMSTLAQRGPLAWDWQKGVFVLVLALFAVGTVVFLLNLFIF